MLFHLFFLKILIGFSLYLSKPPLVIAGRQLGWLFKKTAIWRLGIVIKNDTVSYQKVSRGYKVLSMILDLHVHFPYLGCPKSGHGYFLS